VLATNGSKDPAAIIIPALIATGIAAIAAVAVVKTMEKLPIFKLPPLTEEDKAKKQEEVKEEAKTDEPVVAAPLEWWGKAALLLYFAFFAGLLIGWFANPEYFIQHKALPYDLDNGTFVRFVKCFSIISVPLMLSFFPLYAALRRIKVYNEFVQGAKEGYSTIISIIPNLVAILVAIAMFRGAGGIDILTNWLRGPMTALHFPPELLPMALIRPLTGSGSMGVFVDIVQTYGPDNILSRMAGTIYGSTETTFYVLAVYFGVVNIKRARHSVPAGLVADTVAIISSVAVCKLMFG
jgi:spore maturation protein B